MSDFDFIESLGGVPEVAKALGLNRQRVRQWRYQGIAWKFRPKLADLAKQKGVEIPVGFLDATHESKVI